MLMLLVISNKITIIIKFYKIIFFTSITDCITKFVAQIQIYFLQIDHSVDSI